MRHSAILMTLTAILFAIPGTANAGFPPQHSFLDPGFDFWYWSQSFDGVSATPQSLNVTIVITPAGITLTEDHAAVIAADSDEFGVASAVCVQPGSPAVLTELVSAVPLESGDRLTDFVEVDFDPATGETVYVCRVEY